MTKKVRIGLLSPFFKPISGYERAAISLDVDLVIVTPSRIDWKAGELDALLFNGQEWVFDTVPIPHAIYNRYYGPKPKVVNRLELVIGKNKVFNHITRFDKWEIHKILVNSSLKSFLPESSYYSAELLKDFLDRRGQAILKPTTGQLGTDVYLVRLDNGIYHLHHGTNSPVATFGSWENFLAGIKPFTEKRLLLQQFIPLASIGGRIFDLRLLLQKDGRGIWQVSGALTRYALRYSYITNLSQAIVSAEEALQEAFPAQEILPKLEQISIKVAQAVESSLGSLGEISVDFGLEQNGSIWIIELNAKPMKSLFGALGSPQIVQNIYEQPLNYALYLART